MKLLLLASLAAASGSHDGGRLQFEAAGCLSCHRYQERGGASGPDLTLLRYRRNKAWLKDWLDDPRAWKAHALMPNPRLKPPARDAIIDYLVDSPGPRWTPAPTAEKNYVKAGCAACHGPKGRGGDPVAPALAKSAETYTLKELAGLIRDGKKADPVPMPAWKGVLSETEIEALAAYVATLADGPKDW